MASPVTSVWRGCVPPTPPNQFSSSSPEVRTWRQEYGSIFQQLESSPAAWGSRWRGLSPTSVLRLKCYGLSPFLEQIHISTSPSFPHCPALGPPALLSVYEDLKAHLVQCAQEKTGRDLPDLQPEEAGSNLVKVEQCQGKAELRSPKSSTNVLASVSGVEWRRGESRSQMAARTCWLSWSVVSCLGSKGKNSS